MDEFAPVKAGNDNLVDGPVCDGDLSVDAMLLSRLTSIRRWRDYCFTVEDAANTSDST